MLPDSMTQQEFTQLVETGISPFTVMLAITTGENLSAHSVRDNGTGALILTETYSLLVTNYHVYKGFLDYRDQDPSAKLLMSGAEGIGYLDISTAVVRGLDKESDLAVLHMPIKYGHLQKKLFFQFLQPHRRPEPGMLAVIYGYPGMGRIPQGMILGAHALTIGLPVARVSDRHFIVFDENSEADVLIPEGSDPKISFGGMSGSAVYVMAREMENIKSELFLAGFVYEVSVSEPNLICVTYADRIKHDGTIL